MSAGRRAQGAHVAVTGQVAARVDMQLLIEQVLLRLGLGDDVQAVAPFNYADRPASSRHSAADSQVETECVVVDGRGYGA